MAFATLVVIVLFLCVSLEIKNRFLSLPDKAKEYALGADSEYDD